MRITLSKPELATYWAVTGHVTDEIWMQLRIHLPRHANGAHRTSWWLHWLSGVEPIEVKSHTRVAELTGYDAATAVGWVETIKHKWNAINALVEVEGC